MVNIKSHHLGIKSVISKSLLGSSILTLAIALMGSIYFNRNGIQIIRESSLKREQQLLSNFLIPAITIADMMEVRRLLSLASDKNRKFAVIDDSGNILISNYIDFNLIRKFYPSQIKSVNCRNIKTGYQKIDDNKLWINCLSLMSNEPDVKHSIGILISYSPYSSLWYSSFLFYFFGLASLSLLLNVIWIRRILHKRLLNPLTVLGSKIIEIARSPFNSTTCLEGIENLPYEINEIKNAFKNVLAYLQLEYQQRTESEKKSALLDQAARVAHDIRSPIAAMEMSVHMLSQEISNDNIHIMKTAIQSVRDIANNLLAKYRKNQDFICESEFSFVPDNQNIPRPILLWTVIEQVISQKRYEWVEKKCELTFKYMPSAKSIMIDIIPNEVKRVVSNLLNNSMEACINTPKIEVKLNKVNDMLELCIIDNGSGISAEKIEKVLNGESSKHAGKRLGLTTAMQYIESIGGKLTLFSKPNTGTTLTLTFKICSWPTWYPTHICLSQYDTVFVLDDDTSMQALWLHRLQSHPVNLRLFSKYEEIFQSIKDHSEKRGKTVLLIDYELSEKSVNGLTLLNHFNVKQNGYLITSHADEVGLQKEVEKLGVWLIPKALANGIPIRL